MSILKPKTKEMKVKIQITSKESNKTWSSFTLYDKEEAESIIKKAEKRNGRFTYSTCVA